MSVISNLPAMPNRIAIACEYLAFLGTEGALEDVIAAHLSPPIKKTDAEESGSGKSMAEDVVVEMKRLGLISYRTENTVSLSDEILNLAKPDVVWLNALRPLLLQRLTSPDLAGQFHQVDFPDAAAWLLLQDPFVPSISSGGGHVQRIVAQLGESDALRVAIGNDQRYQNLLYWARYLGLIELLGTTGSNIMVADPTSAIDDCLLSVFRGDFELPVIIFLQRLADICPVFEEGSVRRELEVRLDAEYQRKDRYLSRSTSLALTRLSLRSRLQLASLSDAESWLLDLGNDTQSISHLRILGKERV